MANGTFNVALGREVEFHNRVDNSDPTNAVLVMVVLASSGLEIDATLKDYDTLSALLAASNNEVTNGGYARIILDDTDIVAYTVDDTDDEIRLPLGDQTFSTILVGDSWRKLLICYDSDSTGGTDANIVPVKYFDVLSTVTGQAIVPNGGDIIFSFPDGYHVAT
jgi:hypothetical protein